MNCRELDFKLTSHMNFFGVAQSHGGNQSSTAIISYFCVHAVTFEARLARLPREIPLS